MSNRWKVAARVLWVTALLLGAFLAGMAVYLLDRQGDTIERLTTDRDRRDTLINFLADSARADRCRSELEDTFLGAIGTLVLEGRGEGEPSSESLQTFVDAVERIKAADEVCPLPDRPVLPEPNE